MESQPQSLSVGITGGGGFIARHLAAALRAVGMRVNAPSRAELDFLVFTEALRSFAAGQTVIVHAAGVNRGTDRELIEGSIVTTLNLCRAIEDTGARPAIIFLSSAQAARDTVYGTSKRRAETLLAELGDRVGLPVTIFRMCNIFGPGGRPQYNSVVATFCSRIANGEPLDINPDGARFQFLHVRHVVKRVVSEICAPAQVGSRVEEIGRTDALTVPELAEIIRSFPTVAREDQLASEFEKDLYRTYRSYVSNV